MDFAVTFLISLLVIGTGILRYVIRNFNYWKDRNVPYIEPYPVFGSTFRLALQRVSVGTFFYEIYQKTKGPVLGFFVFDQPYLLIRSPDLIKSILVKDFEYFCDRSVTENPRDDKIGSHMLFLLKNPAWKQMRIKLTPTFSSGKVKNMLPLIMEVGAELASYISSSSGKFKSVEVQELCRKYTIDVISSFAFGKSSYSFRNENSVFRVVAQRILDTGFLRSLQMACYFFAPVLVKPFRMKILDPAAGRFMKEVTVKAINEREELGSTRGDLIDFIIQNRKQQSNSDLYLDDDVLTAQPAIYFLAGFETSGSTISMALYELSLNLNIQNRLREEIVATLKQHRSMSYESIQSMTYLDMVLKETLRKYPALSFLDRRCNRDYPIPGTDIVIKKGIPIYISLLGIQRDPDYFPDPDIFDPERFSVEKKDSLLAICNLPFGSGPRGCPGRRFALLSSKVAMIRILTQFQVEAPKDTPKQLVFERKRAVLSAKGGLNLNFIPITTALGMQFFNNCN